MAVPNAPDITVAQLTESSFRVTIDGDAGVTNYVLYATEANAGDTWTAGGNRVGDGTVDVAGLTAAGTYYVIAYSTNADGKSIPSNIVKLTLTGDVTGAPTRIVPRKQKLMQQEVISEDRDATITRYVYACMVGATLANQSLTPGTALPGDATSFILSSKLLPARGTAEQQIEVIARKARAYA